MNNKANRGLYRRDGSPFWWIRYADRNGRIIRESTGTKEKKLAVAILAKKKVQVAENKHLDVRKVPNTTFYELCDQYWSLEGKHKRTKGLDSVVKIWKNWFGNVPCREITQQKVEKFLADKMEKGRELKDGSVKKLSPATRNRHLAYMSVMFNKGKEWGLVVENPAAGIKPVRENGARTRFLSQEEIHSLLEAATEEFCPILLTALHTGMRRGEIIELRWTDVDFNNRMITIQDSKSGKKRMIPINDILYETLKVLPSRFQKGYVFPSPVRPEEPWRDFRWQFHKAVKQAQIKNLRFHDLRHTFASHLVMNGVDVVTVKEFLGHASLTMTLRYAHLAPDHRLRAIKTLDSAYQTDTKTDTVENSGLDQLPQVVEN